MAYDAARGEVVLFGGFGHARLGDTWTWDGTDWTKQHPAHSPDARQEMGMTWDDARGHVILFGGFDGAALGDTWTWDGTDWSERVAA